MEAHYLVSSYSTVPHFKRSVSIFSVDLTSQIQTSTQPFTESAGKERNPSEIVESGKDEYQNRPNFTASFGNRLWTNSHVNATILKPS